MRISSRSSSKPWRCRNWGNPESRKNSIVCARGTQSNGLKSWGNTPATKETCSLEPDLAASLSPPECRARRSATLAQGSIPSFSAYVHASSSWDPIGAPYRRLLEQFTAVAAGSWGGGETRPTITQHTTGGSHRAGASDSVKKAATASLPTGYRPTHRPIYGWRSRTGTQLRVWHLGEWTSAAAPG